MKKEEFLGEDPLHKKMTRIELHIIAYTNHLLATLGHNALAKKGAWIIEQGLQTDELLGWRKPVKT
jgi:hypothetical protein